MESGAFTSFFPLQLDACLSMADGGKSSKQMGHWDEDMTWHPVASLRFLSVIKNNLAFNFLEPNVLILK